jgi:trimeric autotransporter adhesin
MYYLITKLSTNHMRNVNFLPKIFNFSILTFFLTLTTFNVCLAQNVEVNPGAGSYTTLKAAFDAINAGTHTGAITVDIIGNTNEIVPAVLNASGSGSASYTSIIISPAGGAARTISGAIAGGSPLIDLNGADNVLVDGLNTGGNSLTIENTTVSATSGTCTIRFQTDATNNTITRCSVLGASTMAVGTNGGNIWFGAGAVTTGNDNNTISNCEIGPSGANLPTKGIYFSGTNTTSTLNNSGITISNNNIFDFFGVATTNTGVYIGTGSTDITISGNRFYQTATRTQTTGTQHSAIWITNTSGNNYQVLNNIIGYASSTETGTYTFVGTSASKVIPIFLNVGTTTVTSVQGNTISNIAISGAMTSTSSTAPFRGIYVASGLTTIGDVTGNTIGSQSATGSITYTSSSTLASDVIAIFNFGSSNWTTNNNTIGGITVSNSSTGASNLYGLRCNTGSGVTWICDNNIIGGNVANSLQSTTTATGSIVQGILNSNPIGTFTGNTVRNLTAAGGTGTIASASVVGICIAASSSSHTIGQNTIYNLNNTNTTAATVVSGIQFTGGSANVVDRNLIYNLTSATNSTSAEINGIRVAGGTTQYRNNMIALGAGAANAIGLAATNSSVAGIIGINEALGTNQFFHNSVYIGGTATAGAGSSFAFNGVQTTNTRSFRNNIFFNARTNSGASGKHYAVKINGTAPNPTGLTINNNIYFANGNGGVFGFFNSLDVANIAVWKTEVGQDADSFESNPQYLDPDNATPDLHIHPTTPTQVEASGSDVGVTLDFDGATRSGLTPVDIGADAGDFVLLPVCSGTPAVSTISGTASVCINTGTTLSLSSMYTDLGITYQWAESLTPGGPYSNLGTGITQATGLLTSAKYYICSVTCTNSGMTMVTAEKSVTINSLPTVMVSPSSGTICLPGGAAIPLVASGTDTYTWSPVTGLSATTGASVTANPTTTTTYTVTGTDSNGCSNTATAMITVTLTPQNINATATPPNICSGGSSTLTASASIPITGNVGTQTTTLSTAGSPYRSGAGIDFQVKTQLLYTAAELTAAGLVAGPISELGFTTTTTTGTLANFEIRLGHSNAATLTTTFETTTTTLVFTQASFMPVSGINMHTFNAGIFTWDGVSNILVQTCQTNTSPLGTSTVAAYNPGFISNVQIASATGCGSLTGTTATNKPIVRFTQALPVPLNWTPGNLMGSPQVVTPASTTIYTVTADNAGCTATTTVTVNITPLSCGSITVPSLICANSNFTLTSNTTGGGEPYTYLWSDGAGSTTANLTQNLAAGMYTYTVTVTDDCGSSCISSGVVTVNELPSVTVTPNTGLICNPGGSAVNLTANGGSTYIWSPSTGLNLTTGATVMANPTVTTIYTVSATDMNGCINTANSTITVSAAVTATATATPASVCTGNTSSLSSTASVPTTISNYTFTNITGQTYTTLTGGGITVINTNAGLTAGVMDADQDDGAAIVTLPFTFNYLGNSFNEATFCTNGWVGLGNQGTVTPTQSRTPANLFTTTAPNNTLAAWFKDMGANFPIGTGSMRHGSIGTDIYAFQWDEAVGSGFTDGSAIKISFQVNLYGPLSAVPGRIEMIYGPTIGTIAGAAAQGIENGTGGTNNYLNALTNNGTSTTTSSIWPGNGNGYRFDPPPAATFLYSWTPAGEVVNPGNQNTNTIALNNTTTYTVTVTNTASGCSSSTSTTVTITPDPTVSIIGNNSPICSNNDAIFNLSGSSGAIVTYNINGGASQMVTLTAGTATITVIGVSSTQTLNLLSVTDGTCTALLSGSSTVTIQPNVTAGTISGSASLCFGSTSIYTTDGTSAGTWTSDNTAVATVDPSSGLVSALAQGSAIITYTVSSGCGAPVSTSQSVSVAAIDYANLQWAPTASICQGSTFDAYGQVYEAGITEAPGQGTGIDVEFGISPINVNSNPDTWTNWTAATFNVQAGNNDEYWITTGAALGAGTYYYTFRYRLSGCTAWQYGGHPNGFWNGTTQTSGVLTVNPIPSATIASNNSPVCVGGDAIFNLSGTTDAVVTYNINGGTNAMVTLTGGLATLTVNAVTTSQTLNLVSITDGICPSSLSGTSTVNIVASAVVTSTADAGPGTLRAALNCVVEGGTIMYDQPTTSTTVLTTPLIIDKNVTIMGLSPSSRPEITTDPTSGISIDATKTLTLKDVDIKSTSPTQTFTGLGEVSITGTTVGKQ